MYHQGQRSEDSSEIKRMKLCGENGSILHEEGMETETGKMKTGMETEEEPSSPCTRELHFEERRACASECTQTNMIGIDEMGRVASSSEHLGVPENGMVWSRALDGQNVCSQKHERHSSIEDFALTGKFKMCLRYILHEHGACRLGYVRKKLQELQEKYPQLIVPSSTVELSVELRKISVYKSPGVYVLKPEFRLQDTHSNKDARLKGAFAHACVPLPFSSYSGSDAFMRTVRNILGDGIDSDINILSIDEYKTYCREYERKYEEYFRLHQVLRNRQLPVQENEYARRAYTKLRQSLEHLKARLEAYQSTLS